MFPLPRSVPLAAENIPGMYRIQPDFRKPRNSGLASLEVRWTASAKLLGLYLKPSVKFRRGCLGLSVKMKKRKKTTKKPKIGLDTYAEKRRRGRPRRMPADEIYQRAENYRWQLWEQKVDGKKKILVRDRPHEWAERILKATSEAKLNDALEGAPLYVRGEFRPFLPLILSILQEKTLPKTMPAQLDYLADSLAGLGQVSPRSSRDICGQERARQRAKSPYQILRHEYYVECSCGYKGPAHDNACRKCGAEINLFQEMLSGTGGIGQF